jgi:hypothetical protein
MNLIFDQISQVKKMLPNTCTILYEEDLVKSAYKPKYELRIFNCPSIFLATY